MLTLIHRKKFQLVSYYYFSFLVYNLLDSSYLIIVYFYFKHQLVKFDLHLLIHLICNYHVSCEQIKRIEKILKKLISVLCCIHFNINSCGFFFYRLCTIQNQLLNFRKFYTFEILGFLSIVIGLFTFYIHSLIYTTMILFCFLFEKKDINKGIKHFQMFVFLYFIAFILLATYCSEYFPYIIQFLYLFPYSFPYANLLPLIFMQIKIGKYKLQEGEVFAGTLATNFSLYFFCKCAQGQVKEE